MSKNHEILMAPLWLSILGVVFCVWIALGNEVNFCVTTGCTLYYDVTFFGISLWWIGCSAFIILAALAIAGNSLAGYWISGCFLLGDLGFLGLMSITAPCVSCLTVALFFAVCFILFKRAWLHQLYAGGLRHNYRNPFFKSSIILWVWTLLFVINVGAVMRAQFDIWPILDESEDPQIKMFFSPSCHWCREGINVLSGNVNVAFYPVADNNADIYRIEKMINLLNDGMSLADALNQSLDVNEPGFIESLYPHILLLRLRLIINKAHIFAAGSESVPFFETKGLPGDIMAKVREKTENQRKPLDSPDMNSGNYNSNNSAGKDHALPSELDISPQCVGDEPCPPAE